MLHWAVALALRYNKSNLIVLMKSLCSLRKQLQLIHPTEWWCWLRFKNTVATWLVSSRRSDAEKVWTAELTPLNPSWTFGGKC